MNYVVQVAPGIPNFFIREEYTKEGLKPVWGRFTQCRTYEWLDEAEAVARAYGGVAIRNPLK